MGFMGHPFLETPHLDRLARKGVHFENAFVTTSLCSPSRASILTGLYAHNHGVVDNYHPVDSSLVFFPQLLQEAGYETAFIGKWHMGDLDEPQRGFDHWVAFRGQGTYYPDGHGTSRVVPQTRYDGFNINGRERVPQKGYITDELTDYALNWLDERETKDKPFFLYISHKAVHSDFVARDEDRGMYAAKSWTPPSTFAPTAENMKGKPRWLIDQRNSRHGVDYGYNLDTFDVTAYHKRYCEALTAVDDNVGRIMAYLENEELKSNTLLVYMGDNGFQFGEHGLIDKRTAYEASIRVPLLMYLPNQRTGGNKVSQVVANIDIAPTLLDAAGVALGEGMDGDSFRPLALGKDISWRKSLLYEYYWEWNYPQTPTVLAVRGDRYKFIRYHGIWDTDELYDLEEDPEERVNLIRQDEYLEIGTLMKNELFQLLAESGGLKVPLLPDRGRQFYYRNPNRSMQGPFPEWFTEEPEPVKK
jgi:N-acetylglucosamine-6-sulfatase